MNNKNRGAITIYLSIILSAVFMMSGILMDIVRIRAAEVQVQRAANTAATSALAGYNTILKEDYGLFALHNSDVIYLGEDIEYYLMNQLITEEMNLDKEHQAIRYPSTFYANGRFNKVRFIDLYDYRLENIEVTPIYNFTENEIMRQQIVEYMKYRAPVQFAENFMEKIDYVSSSKDLTSGYKQKTAIEKKLGKIEKALSRLQEHINQINKFEKKNFDCSPNSTSQLMSLCKSTILKEIYRECRGADFGTLEPEDEEAALDIKERINELYEKSKDNAKNSKNLLDEQLLKCKNAVEDALRELVSIQNLSKETRRDIDSLKLYLQDLKNQEGEIDNSQIITALQKDIYKYEELLSSENSQSISADLDNNIEVLNYLRISISELTDWITSESRQISARSLRNVESSFRDGSDMDTIDKAQFDALVKRLSESTKLKAINEAANRYEALSSILNKDRSGNGKDPRKKTAEAAKKIRKEIQGEISNPTKIENPKLLPSYYVNGSYPNKIFSETVLKTQESFDDMKDVVEDFDVDFNEDSSFVDDSFDFLIEFAEKLKDKALDMRNEIYVNEYIIKIFKDAVEIDEASTDGKSSTTLFEKGEVEYIIGGNSYEEVNKYLVRGQILLIRLGMNTLHVYSDSQKRLHALELATGVAGFTGFGIPIAHNLIMCAWGAAESFYDINEIYNGKRVPFIKNVDNWKTDLLPTGFNTRDNEQIEGGIMDFDYHDYLRLLLLAKNKEVKMNRIEDLIQLNLQQNNADFKLNSCNTYIKVNAQVSIKYWFITKLFVPSKYKTNDGSRHIINMEVWRGY